MELHVHRQMLQVLNQQREEKLEHRNTAHEDKQPMKKFPHSESNKGESVLKSMRKQLNGLKWGNSFALKNENTAGTKKDET